MIATVARVMWLSLRRDRGSLILAFLLPPLLFVVFAEVFTGAGDADLELRVAVMDSADSALTQQIHSRLEVLEGFALVAHELASDPPDLAGLQALVRRGQADAAVWLRAEPDGDLDAPAPILVIGDASRALAAAIITGRVQMMLDAEFPGLNVQRAAALIDALVGPYTDDQREALALALDALQADALEESINDEALPGGLVTQDLLGDGRNIDPGVSYYAGAVAIMFLLFAGMQGAISLIDERNSGIVDRLMAGPGGYTVVVVGKGLFLTLQGMVQAGLIFAAAWLIFGLAWLDHFGPWLVTTLLASAAAAWLGLFVASWCQTRQQAQTASAFFVLILSAIGGSMMPRFLMPGWLRDFGWFTPNAWAIESWHGIYWRDETPADQLLGWALLGSLAVVAMAMTIWTARRMAREK
ncbi:MAG: ABC transporter permease [Wenzhouxiangella sp.]